MLCLIVAYRRSSATEIGCGEEGPSDIRGKLELMKMPLPTTLPGIPTEHRYGAPPSSPMAAAMAAADESSQWGPIERSDPLEMTPSYFDSPLPTTATTPPSRQCVDDPDLHVGKLISVKPPLAHQHHLSCPRRQAHSKSGEAAANRRSQQRAKASLPPPSSTSTNDMTVSSNFFSNPSNRRISPAPICSVDGDNRLPPAPIHSVHQLANVDPTMLSSIPDDVRLHHLPSSFAHAAAFVDCQLRPCPLVTPSASCRPPSLSTLPLQSVPSTSVRSASV
ncbi:hypothetical protein ACLOJK_018935 [Asimina triloba]